MTDRLPTVFHGIPRDDEDCRLIENANQTIVALLNDMPQPLVPRVVCSVLTSVCAAQDDPSATFQTIGLTVLRAVQMIAAEIQGEA